MTDRPYPTTNKAFYPADNLRYWSRDKQSQDKKEVLCDSNEDKITKILILGTNNMFNRMSAQQNKDWKSLSVEP